MTVELPDSVEIAVVGAGLAGLACAHHLHAAGHSVTVFDTDDRVGGRVRTDVVDGFRLDHGLQFVMTGFPEIARQLDLRALDIKAFDARPSIWLDGSEWPVIDAFSGRARLRDIVAPSQHAVLPALDRARLVRLRQKLGRGEAHRLLLGTEQTTLERLRSHGFGQNTIDRFFRPLVATLLHDPDLETSSRIFDLVLRRLGEGGLGVPSLGMARIPAQLAESLPTGSVHLGVHVDRVAPGRIVAEGSSVAAEQVVVATDGPSAASLAAIDVGPSLAVGCLWFGADVAPTSSRSIVLNGSGHGPVRSIVVVSNAAPSYAPAGRHLVAASCPGDISTELVDKARAQLRTMFGGPADDWMLLRVDRIEHAVPHQRPPTRSPKQPRIDTGLWVCGDHRATSSMQGALASGRLTADEIVSSASIAEA